MHAAPDEIPSSLQQLELQEPCPLLYLVALAKEGRAPAALTCEEEGISPGAACIQMTPAEIPFSILLLKIQDPCPPFHMVTLGENLKQEYGRN